MSSTRGRRHSTSVSSDPCLARRIRGRVVALACVVALAGVAVAPAAVSALQHLFDVDEVSELGAARAGCRAPVRGTERAGGRRSGLGPVPRADDLVARSSRRRPRARRHHGRNGDDRLRGRQDPAHPVADDRRARPHRARPCQRRGGGRRGRDLPALWIEGAARGTFTLIGADGAVHRESFEVGTGVLLWNDGAMTFLLQGAELQGRGDAARRRGRPLAAKHHPARNWPTSRATMPGSSNQGM